jgi:hypothetical protein
MKRKVLAMLAGLAILGLTVPAAAHRFHRTDSGHFLRVIAYGVHGVGTALEYWVFRPIHRTVSKEDLDITFGHQAHMNEDGTYDEWLHADYTPSIGVEREMAKKAMRPAVK